MALAGLPDAFAACSRAEEAAKAFREHGFCVLAPELAGFGQNCLNQLREACVAYTPHAGNLRPDADDADDAEGSVALRYSLNSQDNMADVRWRDAAIAAVQGPVGECLRQVAGQVRFDLAGGDVVHAGGHGQSLHSDDLGWWGGYDWPGSIAVSIFVDDATDKAAPLRIVPKSVVAEPPRFGQEIAEELSRRVLAPRGAVLVRDVNVWHSGTANETLEPRYLPGFRVITSARLGDFAYRPRRCVSAVDFERFFPTEELATFFEYIWREATQEESDRELCLLVRRQAFRASASDLASARLL